jgi:hypothetical protein
MASEKRPPEMEKAPPPSKASPASTEVDGSVQQANDGGTWWHEDDLDEQWLAAVTRDDTRDERLRNAQRGTS